MSRLNQSNNELEVQNPQGVPSPMAGMMGGNMGLLTPEVAGKMTQVLGEMWLAKNFPRNIAEVQKSIDNACASVNLAQKGFYTYAKAGTPISGPSIRLAEAIAAAYGNISYGFEVVSTTDKDSKIRAYAFDKQTNCSAERLFTVPHFIHTKNGDKLLTDPRDIYELQANYASRRIRACILEVIPINLVDYAVEACENTLKVKVNLTPERISAMLTKFSAFGVTKQHIETFIQRSVESIQPAQFVRLIGIYESLQDKMAKPEDFFDMSKPAEEPKKKAESEEVKEQVAENGTIEDAAFMPEDDDAADGDLF